MKEDNTHKTNHSIMRVVALGGTLQALWNTVYNKFLVIGYIVSQWCACLFAYRTGKWDSNTSGHSGRMWRRMFMPGVNWRTQSCKLVIRSPGMDVNTKCEQAPTNLKWKWLGLSSLGNARTGAGCYKCHHFNIRTSPKSCTKILIKAGLMFLRS